MPRGPTRIHFNEIPKGIDWLAVRGQSTRNVHGVPPLPTARTERERVHYSEADLEDVTHLTPHQNIDSKKITGILLHYSDGRRACVGSFRLDHAGAPLDVRGAQVIHLGYGRSPRRWEAFVMRIELEVPKGGDGLEWRAVPLEGKFEWWLSRAGTTGDHGEARPRPLLNPETVVHAVV